MLEFSRSILPDLSNYDEDGACKYITPFVVTFNPALPNASSIVPKDLNILRSSARCKQTFPSPPVVAYKRRPSLPGRSVGRSSSIISNHYFKGLSNLKTAG